MTAVFWLAAGLLGTALHDAKEYGWELEPKSIKHNWEKLRDSVQDYISGTNFGYRTALRVRRWRASFRDCLPVHKDGL